jgi:hypothetical protein
MVIGLMPKRYHPDRPDDSAAGFNSIDRRPLLWGMAPHPAERSR